MFNELVLIFITLCILYYFKERNISKDLPPGPFRLPYIGSFLELILAKSNAPYLTFQKLCQKYGPVMFIKLGKNNQVIIEDYEITKEVLNSDIWIDRYFNEWFSRRSFGKTLGVLIINGNETWREMRRFSIRTLRDFGFGKQKSMEITIEEELSDLMSTLTSKMSENNGIVAMKQFFTISVLNILWNMIGGERFSHTDAKLHELITLLERLIRNTAIGSPRMTIASSFPLINNLYELLPWDKFNKYRNSVFEGLHGFFREILKERRADGHYKIEQRDFIDVFLCEIDAHSNEPPETNLYTDEQFLVVVMDLFMAGSETTSNTMEFAILYMIAHPELQIKIQNEIDTVVGNSRFPSVLDRTKMPLTEATLLEVQRLANVVPMIVRSPTKECKIGKYTIPQGTIGVFNFYAMHTNEKMWEDPFKFNPYRFLDSSNNIINANKILPFGFGKRICLGEQLAKTTLFTFFTSFLQRFNFEPSPMHQTPSLEHDVGFTLSPKPYHALITQRK